MYRDLLMKITVIRNTHMDQMCLMDEAENVRLWATRISMEKVFQ